MPSRRSASAAESSLSPHTAASLRPPDRLRAQPRAERGEVHASSSGSTSASSGFHLRCVAWRSCCFGWGRQFQTVGFGVAGYGVRRTRLQWAAERLPVQHRVWHWARRRILRRKPTSQVVMPGGIASAVAFGSTGVLTVQAVAGPQSVEDRLATLETQTRELREA